MLSNDCIYDAPGIRKQISEPHNNLDAWKIIGCGCIGIDLVTIVKFDSNFRIQILEECGDS